MTSTAELRGGRAPSWLRALLVLALLGLGAAQTPLPWGVLWLAIPAAVGISLLIAWRFGSWALIVPALLAAAVPFAGGSALLWGWWIPAAALSGVWMGLAEERGAPAGERAWMLLPALLLAAALPWTARYRDLVTHADREVASFFTTMQEMDRQAGASAEVQSMLAEAGKGWRQALPFVLPTGLFVWIVALAAAGRLLSARLSATLRWPTLARGRLLDWRLPDGALWTFLAGLGLLVSPWTVWAPTAWTLLLNSGLGYCVQGIAVVESLLLARGVPPSLIILTMAFVFTIAMPVFVLTTTAVGLSDVWLDYRRLDPVRDGTQS